MKTIPENVVTALRELKPGLRAGNVLGYEGSPSFNPSTYASTFSYGAGLQMLLGSAFPSVSFADATINLSRLRSVLTQRELALVRRACAISGEAFVTTASNLKVGIQEFDAAALLRSNLLRGATGNERCDGFAYCMSGPNSAKAYAAFQQTCSRRVEEGDFVLLHCNSYCGGFWTDVTRTFSMGRSVAQNSAITEAVLEASDNAISAVRPGIRGSAIDEAARSVLDARGYGKAFNHGTGHGVGFAAINHNALPRIHPLSEEILEPGMVFNVEPAVYIPEVGGVRQCNMVAVTETGVALLTGFQNEISDLILG